MNSPKVPVVERSNRLSPLRRRATALVLWIGLGLTTFAWTPVYGQTSTATTPQATPNKPLAEVGAGLFQLHCEVCHQPAGQGQIGFAPSIRNRDFLALASDDFIKHTIQMGRPGTPMVARPELTEEDLKALLAFLRSLQINNPIRVTVDWEARFTGDAKAGQEKFGTFCAGCHGTYGDGYGSGGAGTGIGLPGFLAVASDDYILQTTKLGRMGTPMKPFVGARGLANLADQDIYDIIAHLRHLGDTYDERANLITRAPNVRVGEAQFSVNCAPCHQIGGVGKVGFAPSIRNRDFLAMASNYFIKTTVRNGRPGTGMLARGDLPEQALEDIIAYLRALPVENPVEIEVNPSRTIPGDIVAGESSFTLYCSACHGPTGDGYSVGGSGPGIGLPGFLKVASDDYILKTLQHGRIGTAMKPFIGPKGVANLETSEVHNIIAYLRSMENRVISSAGGVSEYE